MNKKWARLGFIIATGFIVLTLLSTVLVCAKLIIFTAVQEEGYRKGHDIIEIPVAQTADELKLPEFMREPVFRARFRLGTTWMGAIRQTVELPWDLVEFDYVRDGKSYVWTRFDSSSGRIIRTVRPGDGSEEFSIYAGPNGIARSDDEKLGRFSRPLRSIMNSIRKFTLYDQASRRFYTVDFDSGQVKRSEAVEFEPVQVGDLVKNMGTLELMRVVPASSEANKPVDRSKLPEWSGLNNGKEVDAHLYISVNPVLVLAKDGTVYRVDMNTMAVTKTGELANVSNKIQGYLGRPADLYCYDAKAVKKDGKYAGIVTAAVSRNFNRMGMAYYDANGTLLESKEERLESLNYNSKPGLFAAGFAFDSLHPLLLNVASYFFGGFTDGMNSKSSIYLVPDSIFGQFGMDRREPKSQIAALASIFLIPSILFSMALAYFVARNAKQMGMSRREIFWWRAGTIAFGISAFITYWLTRPSVGMVTCSSCGELRRTDLEECNVCGASWEKAKKAAPQWRVVSEPDETDKPQDAVNTAQAQGNGRHS